MKSNKQNTEVDGFDQLVSKLKATDAMYTIILKVIQIFYIVFIPLFIIYTVIPYFRTGNITPIFSMIFNISALVIIAWTLTRYYKTFKNVDYSLPTLQMLKHAENRYKPVDRGILWVALAVVLIIIGKSIERYGELITLQTYILPAGLILFGLITGYIIWYFKFKPLHDKVVGLIREIES